MIDAPYLWFHATARAVRENKPKAVSFSAGEDREHTMVPFTFAQR